MSEFIPLSVPNFCGNERKYVDEALDGAWVSTSGAKVGEMEECIAKYVGMPEAVCCASGSAGLHLAALVAGVKPGDEVIGSATTQAGASTSLLLKRTSLISSPNAFLKPSKIALYFCCVSSLMVSPPKSSSASLEVIERNGVLSNSLTIGITKPSISSPKNSTSISCFW